MDNKVQKNINSNKTKGETKFKVNIKGNKDVKMELLDFYNQKIKKMHIVLLIITVILFVISFYTTFSAIRAGNYTLSEGIVAQGFVDTLKENVLLDLVIIIAGITTY